MPTNGINEGRLKTPGRPEAIVVKSQLVDYISPSEYLRCDPYLFLIFSFVLHVRCTIIVKINVLTHNKKYYIIR